jgi:colicin import membrane protein
MAISLYDILEVSKLASPEAISESYKRLYAKYSGESASGNEDATNRLIALREACTTLANPEKRKAYDQRLAASEHAVVYEETPPRWSFLRVLIIVSVLGTCGVIYSKHKASEEQARLKKEEMAAALRLSELEAQKAIEEKLAAEKAEYQQRRDEAYERANRDREYRYATQVSRDIQRAESQARWEKEQQARQQEKEERQKQSEAERQLAREKAYLRRIEAENARYPRY